MQPERKDHMETPEIADVLERAADLLFVYGRTRGVGAADDGSMCVRGAIRYAQGYDPKHVMGNVDASVDAFERYLGAHHEVIPARLAVAHPEWLERDRFPAWAWNDFVDDDGLVLDTLRFNAKELRA